jgi:hypothetical protein
MPSHEIQKYNLPQVRIRFPDIDTFYITVMVTQTQNAIIVLLSHRYDRCMSSTIVDVGLGLGVILLFLAGKHTSI